MLREKIVKKKYGKRFDGIFLVNRMSTNNIEDTAMSEWVAHLGDAILRAPPAIVIPVAIVLFLSLIRLVLALPEHPGTAPGDGHEAAARRWIDDRIDEHVEVLVEAYRAAGASPEPDELPPGFAMTIEAFIADVLLRELDSDGFDIDLRAAVREFAVLHREAIYQDVAARIRNALAAT
jgi:hypothetical protein